MMQGQGSSSNSLTGIFTFDHDPNGNNLGLDQQNVVLPDASVHDGSTVMGWRGQSSFSDNTQNRFRFQELLGDTRVGIGQRSEETQPEPNIASFQMSLTMSLGNAQVTNGQSILQGRGSGLHRRNIDLNATLEGNGNDTNQDMGAGLGLQLFKTGRPDGDQNPPASDSPNALMISSGIAGYVLEENDHGEGLPSEVRRLSCKRRAPEDASGQLSLGGSSSSAQQAGNSEQEALTAQENASSGLNVSGPLNRNPNVGHSEQLNTELVVGLAASSFHHQPSNAVGTIHGAGMEGASVLHQTSSVAGIGAGAGIGAASDTHQTSSVAGIGAGAGIGAASDTHQTSSVARIGAGAGIGAASDIHQTSSVAGQAETFQRNIRLRRTENQQDFVPTSLPTWTQGNSNVQAPSQAAAFFPFDRFPSSSSTPVVHALPALSTRVQAPNSFQTLQPSQSLNGVNRPRVGGPFIHTALHREENLTNNPRNMVLLPEFERGNTVHIPTNLTLGNGNTNLPGNIASTSLNGPNSGAHQAPPPWFPQQNVAEQYAQRVTDIVNHSESRGQGHYCPIHSGASAASREMEFAVRGGNVRPSQAPPRSGPITRTGAHPEFPPGLRPLTSAQRRSRVVSEVRNALAIVRRGGSLQIEDVMVIDRSVLYGVPEEHDIHEDMRLDVDHMSYEELLALGEHIGNVCTGLSEEAILAHLKRRKYQSLTIEPPVEHEPCCICQEEYAHGEDLGKLDCGHDFHFNCIKQWLAQKNLCPICKMTALALRERDR